MRIFGHLCASSAKRALLFGFFRRKGLIFYTFHHFLPFPKVTLHVFLFIPGRTYIRMPGNMNLTIKSFL